jgi:uncharacterized membrane protein YphA (DoxX/SURF4 family)
MRKDSQISGKNMSIMKSLKQLMQPVLAIPRHELALAILRIGTGAFFLMVGYQKLINPHFPKELPETLRIWAEANPYPLYKGFLDYVAIPNASLLGPAVQFGEVFVGLSYISGFLVPVSSLAALVLNLNIYLAAQHTGMATGGLNILCMLISATLFWSKAGHYFGLDRFVFREDHTSSKKKAAPPKRAVSNKKVDKQVAKIESAFKNAKAASKPKKSKPKNKPFS